MESNPTGKHALQNAVKHWSEFVSKCITQRLDTAQFRDFACLVYAKYPLPAVSIADLLLRPQSSNNVSLDPRIPPYIQILSQEGYIDASSILRALYKHSALHAYTNTSSQQQSAEQQLGVKKNIEADKSDMKGIRLWKSSSWAEEIMFYHVIRTIVEASAFRDVNGALELLDVICKWMNLFVATTARFATTVMATQQEIQAREEMEIARAAFVPLLLRLVDNVPLLKAISQPFAKGIKTELSASLGGFIQMLQPVPQFAEKLDVFRTEVLDRIAPTDNNNKNLAANVVMDELLDSTVGLDNFVIPEVIVSSTRAGLYVYLNASLVGRPILDDNALFAYLNNRHQGNTQSSAIDLILASFDVLATAAWKKPNSKDGHLLRSYLVNKVPLLLCQLCPPEFSTTTSEFCITEALNQIDATIFPTTSLMFGSIQESNPHTDSVREEFCAACALHGLIEREHVDRILGELSMAYNPGLQKHSKDTLVQDCLADPSKIQGLVLELEKMDGNVGAICHALVEVISQLCSNKDTMTLKLLCSQLAQRPQSLDILLLFEKMPSILSPLCHLLDTWRYEEDQGEYQPVYDEFGSILLLLLAFSYRYNVSGAYMGAQASDSPVANIIRRGHVSRSPEDITEQEKTHINGWIQGLFDSDAGGLGDDLMSSCPPSEFYQLIATIFQHIVIAYSNGYVSDETLRSGFEYLTDTFLLPSLVPAIKFLADYVWIDQKEQKSIIKILQLITTPNSGQEAGIMLASVKNLIAQPLAHALRTYQRQDPKNQEIEPLIDSLKENLPLSRRTGSADNEEIEQWVNNSSTGLTGAIRQTIQGLVQWSIQSGLSSSPPEYTHRQIISGLKVIGARRLLKVILEEVRRQVDAGNASIVYDVAVALICAPDVTTESPPIILDASGNMPSISQRPLTLRNHLKTEAEDWKKLQKADATLAEIVVRLYRRVEAQMVMPETQAILQATDMALGLAGTNSGLEDAMVAAAAAAGVSNDAMTIDSVGLDLGLGVDGSGLETTGDNDLFGLDTSMDGFDGWDSMDLGGA